MASVSDLRTDELVKLVGAKRHAHSPEDIAAAEDELNRRAEVQTTASVRRARTVGRLCAVLGLPLSLFSLLFVASTIGESSAPGDGVIFGNWRVITVAVGAMQFVVGLLLFQGGRRFRRCSERGRRQLLAALRVLQAYVLAFSVLFLLDFALSARDWLGGLFFAVSACASGALYLWLLQLAVRYFQSPVIRRVCAQNSVAA